MISICSVTLNTIKHYEKIFLESIIKKTKLVSEVILAQNDSDTVNEEWEERGVKFRRIAANDVVLKNFGKTYGHQHGLGLNFAINKATNDCVYLCDPDVFFYSAADEFFYNLMQKHSLDAVGCSHHSATELCGTFFPWHGNIMLSKNKLPDTEWLKTDLMEAGNDAYIGPRIYKNRINMGLLKGKFLFPALGYNFRSQYPKPEGNFDTGSALWLYAHEKNWRWLSFQTNCVHVYTKLYYRGNIKLKENFGRDKLIHHAVSGSIEKEKWEPYALAYQEAESD